MAAFPKIANRLSAKLVMMLIISLSIIFTFHGVILFDVQKDNLEKSIADSTIMVVDTINDSIAHNMMESYCGEAFNINVLSAADPGNLLLFQNSQ